eukprot:1925417-Heterocapsa_arctica.AAC.1
MLSRGRAFPRTPAGSSRQEGLVDLLVEVLKLVDHRACCCLCRQGIAIKVSLRLLGHIFPHRQ